MKFLNWDDDELAWLDCNSVYLNKAFSVESMASGQLFKKDTVSPDFSEANENTAFSLSTAANTVPCGGTEYICAAVAPLK